MSRQKPEIDLEELAAYADGRLEGERRASVEARLARDEELYEMLLDAARFREEEEAAREAVPQKGRLYTFQARRVRWAAAAAVAAAALVWVYFVAPFGGPGPGGSDGPEFRVAALSQDLATGTDLEARYGADWVDPPGSAWRGEEEAGALRLGALLVDLDASLRAGDRRASTVVLARILGSLKAGTTERTCRTLSEKLAAGAGRAELLELAGLAEAYLGEDLASPDFDLGRWAEAGRLAALAGDEEALRRPAFREALDALLARKRIAPRLEAVAGLLTEEPLETTAIASALTEILAAES